MLLNKINYLIIRCCRRSFIIHHFSLVFLYLLVFSFKRCRNGCDCDLFTLFLIQFEIAHKTIEGIPSDLAIFLFCYLLATFGITQL